MPKRTNEDAQSNQPAAKRSANASAAEIQQELLLRAQASLDRLDYKTTEQICSEIIDSGKYDVVQPLMMRSISLGRRGQYCESVQDAEKALKSKKSLETHLRAAFSYLGLVQHHLNLAKEFSIQENETQNDTGMGAATQSLLSTNVIELEESIQEARSLEKRGSFKRVSPELFTKIVSLCDSPSLAMASGTCKSWRGLISNDTELFRSFTMRGKGQNIIAGLWKYAKKSKDSIRSVKLEVTNKLDEKVKSDLALHLSFSKKTLRSIDFSHQGDLGSELWKLAQNCNRLSTLSSTLLDPVSDQELNQNFQNQVGMGAGPTWQAQLEEFVWVDDSVSLVCDDALLSRLGQAKVVELGKACTVHQDWIVQLFSSSAGQSLVKVKIPSIRSLEQGDDSIKLPNRLQLPNLEHLALGGTPLESATDTGQTFWKRLSVPSLLNLQVDNTKGSGTFRYLDCMKLQSLRLENYGNNSFAHGFGEIAATEFVQSIERLVEIEEVHISFCGTGSPQFGDRFIKTITPQSLENVHYGYKDNLLFPKLKRISFRGTTGDFLFPPSPNTTALACLVASRIAVSRGLSRENVLLAANSHFAACREPPSDRIVRFSSSEAQVCSLIESIHVSEVNEWCAGEFWNSIIWLRENLPEFKHPYLLR